MANTPHKLPESLERYFTWKKVFLSIIGDSILLTLFFWMAKNTSWSFLFRGDYDHIFYEQPYYKTIVIFWGVYTMYTVSKIIYFSLIKYKSVSAFFGSIQRFLDDYIWCLYVCFIPFFVWYSHEGSLYRTMISLERLVFCSYGCAVLLSQYLVPLILLQRIAVTCHFASTNQSIVKSMDNDRLRQTTIDSSFTSLRAIANHYVIRIRDQFCLWLAILVLLTAFPILVMNSWLLAVKDNGNAAMVGVFTATAIERLVFTVICCLAFCIVLRNLFIAFWQCFRLFGAKVLVAVVPLLFVVVVVIIIMVGQGSSWYTKFNWRPEFFFDDPKVIDLCKAIEAKDLKKIDRLVVEGADVNAKGKGNMTPLLWAFPENKPEVFKRILEHGADPHVTVTSEFNTNKSAGYKDTRMPRIYPGDSVFYLAARTRFPNFFRYVMQYGDNPNFVCEKNGKTSPLVSVILGECPDKMGAIQLLIDAGADLEYTGESVHTALCVSALHKDYTLTLLLLQAGASYNFYSDLSRDYGHTFLHLILNDKIREHSPLSPEQKKDYVKVLEWLKANDADLEGAKKDNAVKGELPPWRIAELKKRYEDDLAMKKTAREKKEDAKKE